MRIDLTWAAWFTGLVFVYYTVLFVVSLFRAKAVVAPDGWRPPLVVIVVPARDEERVIGATVENLRQLSYGGGYRILVVDDASSDGTAAIVAGHALRDHRLRVLGRAPQQGGRGKGAVLNHAFSVLRDACLNHDPWLDGRTPKDIVYAIVDADGRLETDALETVAPYFVVGTVGATQIGVRIYNAHENMLARMQDIEFVGFTHLVQIARDRMGSTGLGGNGQFARMSALMSLGDRPWKPSALTEDLDLGLRLVEAGWHTRFCPGTAVSFSLSALPLATFVYTYQRHARHPYKWWEVPAFAVLFSLYSYVWVITTLRAWTRMLLRRNAWVKTPRVVEGVPTAGR